MVLAAGGIHGGETVVERQGDYRIREPSRAPAAPVFSLFVCENTTNAC